LLVQTSMQALRKAPTALNESKFRAILRRRVSSMKCWFTVVLAPHA
jgi:hypothetical protein